MGITISDWESLTFYSGKQPVTPILPAILTVVAQFSTEIGTIVQSFKFRHEIIGLSEQPSDFR